MLLLDLLNANPRCKMSRFLSLASLPMNELSHKCRTEESRVLLGHTNRFDVREAPQLVVEEVVKTTPMTSRVTPPGPRGDIDVLREVIPAAATHASNRQPDVVDKYFLVRTISLDTSKATIKMSHCIFLN